MKALNVLPGYLLLTTDFFSIYLLLGRETRKFLRFSPSPTFYISVLRMINKKNKNLPQHSMSVVGERN
jgi:hypothetical protein